MINLHLYFIRYNWKIVAIWLMAMWSVLMVLVCLRTISNPIVGWRREDSRGERLLNGGTLRVGKAFSEMSPRSEGPFDQRVGEENK